MASSGSPFSTVPVVRTLLRVTSPVRVFVYGTLMRGAANHAVLARQGARFVRPAVTSSPRVLVDLGPYPALLPAEVPAPDEHRAAVAGELWEIDASRLHALDAFEGAPDLFVRETISVRTSESDEDSVIDGVFVYVLAAALPSSARIILPSPGERAARYGAIGSLLPDGAKPEQIAPPTRRA